MRRLHLPPAPMALARALLLAVGMLPLAASVEQRSLLRAGRAAEAMPLITLPQSLLLQSNDADQQATLQGSEEIQAASTHGGYGHQLWNAVQESASEVVDDAREAFFADQTKKAVTTTAVAVTTTTALTTQDPAVLAKQLAITIDTAKARNLLVGMVSRAQLDLLNRLSDISLDLEATQLRAEEDNKAVNHSFVAAKTMPMMASNAAIDVKKIETNGDLLKASLPKLENRATVNSAEIKVLLKQKAKTEEELKHAKKMPGAKKRVENNQMTLGALVPRLEKLERRVTHLEGRLYDGELKKLVDDSTGKEVVNIMEDVSRGFGRFVKNPQ